LAKRCNENVTVLDGVLQEALIVLFTDICSVVAEESIADVLQANYSWA